IELLREPREDVLDVRVPCARRSVDLSQDRRSKMAGAVVVGLERLPLVEDATGFVLAAEASQDLNEPVPSTAPAGPQRHRLLDRVGRLFDAACAVEEI